MLKESVGVEEMDFLDWHLRYEVEHIRTGPTKADDGDLVAGKPFDHVSDASPAR
jgi:hypothetical protein